MEKVEVEYVTLEDGKDYFIVDIIDDYVYLKKEDDDKTFQIRKIVREADDCEYFYELDNVEMYNDALTKFSKKYNGK